MTDSEESVCEDQQKLSAGQGCDATDIHSNNSRREMASFLVFLIVTEHFKISWLACRPLAARQGHPGICGPQFENFVLRD